jgi:hypothetical protein
MPPGSGHHNAGQDCAGCHMLIPGFNWTISGTLYSSANGSAAVAGATIVVTDNNGQRLQLVTCSNGNFYTTTPVAFPITLEANECPASEPMATTASKGSCNTSACHSSGTRIHLP